MQRAKLTLSADELKLVRDPAVILTKNAIIAKVYDLFGALAEGQRAMPLPDFAQTVSPKISRGENYKGLPYVMLDYPRLFTSEHVLAIRTHFWWGNYFSVTLHLKGEYKERCLPELIKYYERFCAEGYLLCRTEDEWEHELSMPWFTPISNIPLNSFESILLALPFVKIAKVFPLDDWRIMHEQIGKAQHELSKILLVP